MTIHFPDVSHYQTGLSLRGATAVIAKATQGTSYRDPAYAGFRTQAAALRIPFAAYHWLDATDLQAQAAHAYAVAGKTPLMWDCEAAGATVPRILDITARHRALGGVARLVYLPHWWWQRIDSPNLQPLAAAGLLLVSSNYPAGGYTETGPGWAPYGGVTPTVWQYTDKQPFAGQKVDFNAYRGSVDDLRALLNPSTTIGADMAWDSKTADNVAFTVLDGGEHMPVHVRLQQLRGDVAKLQAAVDKLTTAGVDMEALATAVADKLAARMKD